MKAWARKILHKHIEPRFYAGLWLCAVCLIAGILILLWRGYDTHKDTIGTLGTILSVVIATIGWIWNGRVQLDMAQRTNALVLLSRLSDPAVDQMKNSVYDYIERYHKGAHERAWRKPKTPKEDIQKLLGVYEQMSVAVLEGAVNEKVVRESQDLIFRRIYLGLRHHIDHVQLVDKKYFCSFEALACRWHPDLKNNTADPRPPGSLFDPLGDV